MKYKIKTKDCYLKISVRAGLGENFDENAMNAFARASLRSFMKPEEISRKRIDFSGPIGISLHDRLQRPVDKRFFLCILEHVVIAAEKIKSSNLAQANVVLDLHYVYINEQTKELRFLYVPTDKPQNNMDFSGFVERVVYTVKPEGNDTEFVYRFNNFLKTAGAFEPAKIENFIIQEDKSVVTALKQQYTGMSGYMTNKPKHYYDHYEKNDHNNENEADETSVLQSQDEEATSLLVSDFGKVNDGKYEIAGEQNGFHQGSFDETGLLQEPFEQSGFHQGSFDDTGLLQEPFEQSGFHQDSFDDTGLLQEPFEQSGFHQDSFDDTGLLQEPFDQSGFHQGSFDDTGLLQEPFDQSGFHQGSFDDTGLLQEPFDPTGLLQEPFGQAGLVEEPFDPTGLLQEPFDPTGLLQEPFDETGLLTEPDDAVQPGAGGGTCLHQKRGYLYRVNTGETVQIRSAVFRLGKVAVDYEINNPVVSRRHAEVIDRNGQFYVVDLGSKNHTYINDEMIPSGYEKEIRNGDRLKLANEEFVFHVE